MERQVFALAVGSEVDAMQTRLSINLSMDVRNAIHGLEVWPFDELP